MFTFPNQGGYWYWLRNLEETKTWTLCANRLKMFPHEIVMEIANYLYDATYQHQACDDCMRGAKWLPVAPKGRVLMGGLRNAEWEHDFNPVDCNHRPPLVYPLKTIKFVFTF